MQIPPYTPAIGLLIAFVPLAVNPTIAREAGLYGLELTESSTRRPLPLCGTCPATPDQTNVYFGKLSFQCTPQLLGEAWYYVQNTYRCSSGTYYTCSQEFYIGGCAAWPSKPACPSSACRPV